MGKESHKGRNIAIGLIMAASATPWGIKYYPDAVDAYNAWRGTSASSEDTPSGTSKGAKKVKKDPYTPEQHFARNENVLKEQGIDIKAIAKLGTDTYAPVLKGQKKPASVFSVLEKNFGTDFMVPYAKSIDEATNKFVNEERSLFVDVTDKIKKEDINYIPEGVIFLYSEGKKFKAGVSLGMTDSSTHEKRSTIANRLGVHGMEDVTDEKYAIIAPKKLSPVSKLPKAAHPDQ